MTNADLFAIRPRQPNPPPPNSYLDRFNARFDQQGGTDHMPKHLQHFVDMVCGDTPTISEDDDYEARDSFDH